MILNADARTVLRGLPPDSVDLIVTDPPYRVISGGNTESGNQPYGRPTGMLAKNDGRIFKHNDTPITDYAADLFRVLRSPGHAYVFTNLLNLWDFQLVLTGVGFKVHNLLVWRKQNTVPNRWYMKNAEYVLFLRKGPARSIYTPGAQMVHDFHNPVGSKTHETEKPVDLMRFYIEASSLPGQVVLDPFMGTGAVGVAAAAAGREFLGIEIDPRYYLTACDRLGVAP